jgi:endo-1,4-beta-xylanase
MKNKIKISGIITLAIFILLAITACDNGDETHGKKPTLPPIKISPATAVLTKGSTKTFTAKVDEIDSQTQTFTWSIVEENKNADTAITNNGTLTVAAVETLMSLTVMATLTEDTERSGTATVTIIPTTPLDPNASDVQTFTSNSGGNRQLDDSLYGYEMWTAGGKNNKLIWYGPNQGGGAAFRAEWNNPNDFLGRIGYFWGGIGELFSQYKNMYADFNYTRSGLNTAGNYSYIGIYGWAKNPSASNVNERLIEYYIVEDWFGNQWQSDTSPMGTGTTQGSVVGDYTLDGSIYQVHKSLRTNAPSIEGTKTFTQYFSIRQTLRKSGTISITEHFKEWEKKGMKLGNLYEAKFLVEAGGGTGWLEFTYLKLSQEDTPR